MLPKLEDRLQGQNGNFSLEDSFQTELDLILQRQPNGQILNRERDLNIYRSGSAPPTVEGSLNAVGSLLRNGISSSSNCGSGGAGNVDIDEILSEDEIRSHPAYLSYYYSNENINPRLPPPLVSKEDWRVAQRFRGGGSALGDIGYRGKKELNGGDRSSLFSMQPGISVQQAENDLVELRNAARRNLSRDTSAEWLERGSDGLIGLPAAGLGSRRKSFADILQEGLDRPTSLSGHLSRPASCNAYGYIVDTGIDAYPAGSCNGVESLEVLHSAAASSGLVGVKNHYRIPSLSFASAVGSSLSRSTTPEAQLVGRSSGSGLPPVRNRVGSVEKKGAVGSNIQNDSKLADISATLSGLSLSNTRHADEVNNVQSQLQLRQHNQSDFLYDMLKGHNQSMQRQLIDKSNAEGLAFSTGHIDYNQKNGLVPNLNASTINSNGQVNIPEQTSSPSTINSNGQVNIPEQTSSPNLNLKMNSTGFRSLEGSVSHHQNANVSSLDLTKVPIDYSVNQKLNFVANNHFDTVGIGATRSLNGLVNQVGQDFCSPLMDPHYVQYLQRTSDYATRSAASASDPSEARNYFGTSLGDLDGFQKAHLELLLAQQKQQHVMQLLSKSGGLIPGYFETQQYRLGLPYPGNPFANSVLPSVGSGSFPNDQNSLFTSMMRRSMGGPMPWHLDVGNNVEGILSSSLLDEFKTNKTRSFELSDIVGHVVEFSTDQYGSRFIQQKLEVATVEEKARIFPEILPHARTLMTDVFGNYVIQKFFEYGTEIQRAQLASQLTGLVLHLSLQMYGCRVIQKALEVVHVDQQTRMVAELDGSIMKCVHDQNGNHVIQKFIECVPRDRIQFIISSFYGQVVALSTHPYGCRVIQRVLKHCDDANTQIIMDEIMHHVCNLAQDQYGNYVIQHVLEHGKPYERTAIIRQLAGQIVSMSEQKFASNVVEKCLTFGSPEERQLLINEMLGSTDENEPLQAMMKDQFGNYVVQKVLETCDDQSLELILSRIRVHLNVLKKYTYGKHIVSRVEKLIETGERRIGLSPSVSS